MKKICMLLFFCISILCYKSEGFATVLDDKVVAGESLEERVVSSLQRKADYIYIADYEIAERDIMDYYKEVLYKHPELFYVTSEIGIFQWPDENNVSSIIPTYHEMEEGDAEWVFEKMNKPLSMLDEDMTTVEKILFLHDYLCVNVEYAEGNTNKDEYHSILGIVTEGKVVCEGYAKAFQYYMNKLEIPCRVVIGGNHAWNQVQIDGAWYMLDVTFDDPTPDEYGRVRHTYFLKSDTKLSDHTWNKNLYQVCNSTTYDDAFWNDVQTQMIYRDGGWYYINGNDDEDMNLYYHDFTTHSLKDKGDMRISLTEKWKVSKTKNHYWFGSYGKIAKFDDKLIYSTPTRIFLCSFDGENVECIAHEMERDQFIYGMKLEGDHLLYQVAKSPMSDKQNIMISMKRTSLSVGTMIKDDDSKASYRVAHSNPAGGAVVYKRSFDHNATSVIVPESIRVDGRNYRVIAIDYAAFSDNKKLLNVKLPAAVMEEMKSRRQRCRLIKKPLGANHETGRN